jgi:hypothetical protein
MAGRGGAGGKGRAGGRGADKARIASHREPTLADEIAASGETGISKEEAAEREQREDLMFLAREFLTWLVHHAEVDGGEFKGDDEVAPFSILFGGKLTLRSPAGLVTDMVLKGPAPVGSPDLRYALAGGLAVKEADLRLEQEERVWTFGLAAEHFDLKRVKLPELLSEGDEERVDERMMLLAQLDAAVQTCLTTLPAGAEEGPARTARPTDTTGALRGAHSTDTTPTAGAEESAGTTLAAGTRTWPALNGLSASSTGSGGTKQHSGVAASAACAAGNGLAADAATTDQPGVAAGTAGGPGSGTGSALTAAAPQPATGLAGGPHPRRISGAASAVTDQRPPSD